MKKNFLFLLCAIFAFALVACNPTTSSTDNGGTASGGNSGADSGTPAPSPTPDPTPEPEVLAFTGTSYTDNGDGTVLFGDFPQSLKGTTVTIDTMKIAYMGDYTYYKGSDDAWYAKNGENYYKVEPIKWKVIDANYDIDGTNGTETGKLLVAEMELIACKYYDYYDVNRGTESDVIYSNNYKESRVRAYLNGLSYTKKASDDANAETDSTLNGKGFLNTGFTATLQSRIATAEVNNDTSTIGSSTYACGNTNDKIFLLSYSEVTKNTYFADDAARIRKPTDFAKATGAYQSFSEGLGGDWWLRSPYNNSSDACIVFNNGEADITNSVDYSNCGVVPALCVSN